MMLVFIGLLFIVAFSDFFIIIGLLFITDDRISKLSEKMSLEKQSISRPKLYIAIALFDESKSIEETIRFFSEFLCDNIRLVLITTEKERRFFGNNNTLEKINAVLQEENNKYITVINYLAETGNKGAQLNYFLMQMKDELYQSNNYIIVYDNDSRPERSSIEEIYSLIKTGTNVIQQSTIYTKNLKSVSDYMQVEGVFETIRSMGIERFNYFLSCLSHSKYTMPYTYCVGHGMCFRCNFLYDLGGFPEPNEDVPQGMKLMLLNEKIVPTISKDCAEVVKNIKILFFQSGNWIKAPFQAYKIVLQIEKIKKITIYRKILFYLKVFFDLFSWIQYGLLLCMSVILIFNKFWIGELGIFLLIFFPIVQILICCKIYEISLSCQMIVLSPFRNIFRSFAIFSALYQKKFKSYNEIEH